QLDKGIAAALTTVETTAEAAGIRGSGGNDDITNDGTIDATATATTRAGNVTFSGNGAAVSGSALWDGGVTAEVTAIGIDGDGGEATAKEKRLTVDGSGVTVEVHKIPTA